MKCICEQRGYVIPVAAYSVVTSVGERVTQRLEEHSSRLRAPRRFLTLSEHTIVLLQMETACYP